MSVKFYLYRRKSRSNFYYVQYQDENKRAICQRSTGETKRDKALIKAHAMLESGILDKRPHSRRQKPDSLASLETFGEILRAIKSAPLEPDQARRIIDVLNDRGLLRETKGNTSVVFIDWLRSMYDYEKSLFIKEKLAHGQSFGKRLAYDRINIINKHYAPFFKSKLLTNITKADLKEFSILLFEKKLTTATVNRTLTICTVVLKWAFKNDLLLHDPTVGLMKFTEKPRERGILTPDEARQVFTVKWSDKRAFIANKLASESGLRAGEVRALTMDSIGEDRLFIRNSFSDKEGLKTPKNGKTRTVPLLPDTRALLLDLATDNPWSDGYLFYGTKPDHPITEKSFVIGLQAALEQIGISESERRERYVDFHSWRHFFAATMSETVDSRALGLVTGHLTPAVLARYAAHANEGHFDKVAEATRQAFGGGDTAK